jgi:uncharacterized protein
MAIKSIIIALLLLIPACAGAQQGKQPSVERIVIQSVEYQLIFDTKEFSVTAGANVELIFRNIDEMPHNLLIVKPGKLDVVGEAADRMAGSPDAGKLQFVPQIPEVMYATRLLMIDEADTLRFKAPTEPGDYPYVCTYPGHWRVMNGIMRVTR